jgi:hypothetical protein
MKMLLFTVCWAWPTLNLLRITEIWREGRKADPRGGGGVAGHPISCHTVYNVGQGGAGRGGGAILRGCTVGGGGGQ